VSALSAKQRAQSDLLEVIRMNYELEDAVAYSANRIHIHATALSMMYSGVQQPMDRAGLKKKSDQLLHDWIQHHSILPHKENTKAFQQFVLQMNSQVLFKMDDMITRFFRICTEIYVEPCYIYLGKGFF
jgi:CCR4-NOT transcription complex subunit 1